MADRILFEKPGGAVGRLIPPEAGSMLVGTAKNMLEWRRAEASNISYASAKSGFLASVGAALDHLITLLDDVRERLSSAEKSVDLIERQNADMVTETRETVGQLNTYVAQSITAIQRKSHHEATISVSSNPALSINGQSLRLDLGAKGSFDDSRSQLGVTSVQLALESLSAKNQELTYQVAALQDAVYALQKKV